MAAADACPTLREATTSPDAIAATSTRASGTRSTTTTNQDTSDLLTTSTTTGIDLTTLATSVKDGQVKAAAGITDSMVSMTSSTIPAISSLIKEQRAVVTITTVSMSGQPMRALNTTAMAATQDSITTRVVMAASTKRSTPMGPM